MEFIIPSIFLQIAIVLHLALAVASSFMLLKFPVKGGTLAILLLFLLTWCVPLLGSVLAMTWVYMHQRRLNIQK
ncbi:MAG: hypothetical protein ACO1NW_02020 [Chitinophagaceae bacterium]